MNARPTSSAPPAQPVRVSPALLVGFAAETDNLESNAREKLPRKDCDLVIANDVSQPGIGFDSDDNEVILCSIPTTPKTSPRLQTRLAHQLVQAILELHLGTGSRLQSPNPQ